MTSLTRQFSRFGKSEEGQAVVLITVALTCLMLMAGLGIDVGYLHYQKEQMQKAADAAALAGATAASYRGSYILAARNDASANGFTNGVNGTSVQVNKPPLSGGYSNKYVEVIISQPQPTFFMRVANFFSVPVRARSVANSAGSALGCIYALDPAASGSFVATGGGTITSACGIFVNSADPAAFTVNGGACVTATYIGIVGGYGNATCSTPAPDQPKFVTGIGHFSDPLAGLPAPTVGACDYHNTNITKNTVTLSPGVYCGGIRIGGSSPTVIFQSGTYILYGGGLTITTDANISTQAGGVTFYNTGTNNGQTAFQPISVNGGNGIQLTASTSGDYTGILFFEDRAPQTTGAVTNLITAQSGSNIVGALYFKTSALSYAGGSDQTAYTVVVANTVKFSGSSFANDNYGDIGGSPIKYALLVE